MRDEWVDLNKAVVGRAGADPRGQRVLRPAGLPRRPGEVDPAAVRGRPRWATSQGRTLVHPQCHFGLDTLSWARRGARVTGLDFSAPAVGRGQRRRPAPGLDADFVPGDVYDAVGLGAGARSTSSTPGSAPSTGCPTSAAGPRSWPRCAARAASSTWPSSTRSLGVRRRRPDGQLPLLPDGEPHRVGGRRGTVRRPRRRDDAQPAPSSGTTASATS